ncbi:hypothetical protein TIFTF001_044959 [Ficus carica]|uniref:Glycosyltransferase n=1 Tax=Ficus carica TaxID=3494 RepID=A0AA87ZWX8_FICCA|nr:hypothetical protein TIFTF001_044959 [Ficus carica]
MSLAESESAKPHVAVLASPGMGHIIPLFEFSKRLAADHGFYVSFLNIASEASAAQTQLLRSPNLPPSLHVIDLPPADVISDVLLEDCPVLTRVCLILQENLRSLKSVLLSLRKPNALVADLFCTDTLDVCHELSIPVYFFYTASSALFAFSLYLPTLDREVDGEFVELPEPVHVPGCSPIRIEDLIDQVRNRKIDEYKWFLYHCSRLHMAKGIFLNTWEDLEPVSLKAIRENRFFHEIPTPPVHPVGPLIKETEPLTETGSECLAWLEKQPKNSVVYIALGSGGTLTAQQITEVAWGLELSKQRFIWVIRAPSGATSSGAFFKAGGEVNNVSDPDPASFLPEGFVERTKEVGPVVPSWAPQIAVLRHEATGAFWSHCGWNSTLESVAHGVPMIAWPLYSEQRMNATILAEDVGVAVKVAEEGGRGTVTREEIARVVRVVIQGEEGKALRRRAEEFKESAAKALNSHCGSSFESLSCVAKEWKALS